MNNMGTVPKKKPMVVAIDGPAASGKGRLGRELARKLRMEYLDTGKLYRLVGKKLMDEGFEIDRLEDNYAATVEKSVEIADSLTIQDVSNTNLNTEKIGHAASIVSSIPEVRKALIGFQRKIAASKRGAVLDGRDIGTVICPDADFKFFITANIETRAERRYKELQSRGNDVIYTDILEDLKLRDERDSRRKISPLRPADDAVCIDTTKLGPDEVLAQVLNVIRARSQE